MTHNSQSNPLRKKLIEVALPLEAINKEAAREKSIRHGHPSTLHLWWARRPLAACRAVLFSQLVDDPSAHPDQFPTEAAQTAERERLFRIIEELVKWENSNDERLLAMAREEIRKSCGGEPPPVYDPFSGGGSIPLEAQRLGLEAHGSDLNPVAVLIGKALIEIPPKFAGKPPVRPGINPTMRKGVWRGASGLAEDVRHYGQWMRDEAEKRIGHLYPKVVIQSSQSPVSYTVIAWLWARTVKCPNPACGCRMPLVRSFALSTKKGKEAWVEPVIDRSVTPPVVKFEVKTGAGKAPEGTKQRGKATCLFCGTSMTDAQLREQSKTKGIGHQLLAIVTEGHRGRSYLSPDETHNLKVKEPDCTWLDQPLPDNARWFSPPGYGMMTYRSLFTPRQLVALTTFSDLVGEAIAKIEADAIACGLPGDGLPLAEGGTGARAYAEAVGVYLGFALDKCTDYWNVIATWMPRGTVGHLFARQAIPMTWDYPEANPFSDFHCSWEEATTWVAKVVDTLGGGGFRQGGVVHRDARVINCPLSLISTDPPYYDNIGYADLSDFFYVWLRRSLGQVFPDLFKTLLVPKVEELVATPYRFGGDKAKAEQFFEKGLGEAFARMRETQHPDFPLTVYYAFKQAESDEDDSDEDSTGVPISTGWETMLEGLLKAGFAITGTWPMRSERSARSVAIGTNALASSIVLVCRPRPESAPMATRREFLSALQRELPPALKALQQGYIAPVDLAQATIGPGMGVFSRYAKVLEADGTPMSVRTALGLINQALDQFLSEQEGEFDTDTRWALAWFEQFAFGDGPFGDAETLCKAKNTSVNGLVEAGFLWSKGGKVRLLRREELDPAWDPKTDKRLTVWEIAQHLIHTLQTDGEQAASELLRKLGSGLAESARDLAYRLYVVCERKGWTDEARAYNALAASWQEIVRMAGNVGEKQREMF